MSFRRTKARVRAAAALAVAASLVTAAPSEGAAVKRDLCRNNVILRDSPNGFAIGHLFVPQVLTLYRRASNGRWGYVKTRTGMYGWLPTAALCVKKKQK